MENLHVKTIEAIQDQIKFFKLCFGGENSKLDLLLCNMEAIMSKYRQELATLEEFRSTSFSGNGDCQENKKRTLSTSAVEANDTGSMTKHRVQDSNENHVSNEAEAHLQIDHKIFTVELVMRKILNSLPFSDLKLCREINSCFKFFADQVISSRKRAAVRFTYNKKSKEYMCNLYEANPINKDGNSFTLSAFSKFYASRPGFPSKVFEFSNGTLRSPDLQEFLTVCGTRIEEISFDVFCTSSIQKIDDDPQSILSLHPTVSFLKKLLLHQVPNLKTLSLRHCPRQWNTEEYCNQLFPVPQDKEYTLPVLQILSVDKTVSNSLTDNLLKVCTNLQTFHAENYAFLPLLGANKLFLLQNFVVAHESMEVFHLYENTNLTLLSQLTSFYWDPSLRNFSSSCFPKLSQILEQVLEASSTTLQNICFEAPIGFLHDLKISVCPKVKLLEFAVADPDMEEFEQLSKKQFPSGFNLRSCFPNLQEVRIFMNYNTNGVEWEHYFDNYTPVLTVKTLILHYGQIPNIWFQNFATLFPNIQTLKVRTGIPLNQAAQCGLWSFSHLEYLVLKINLNDHNNYFPVLDSAFTGFSVETCSEMEKSLNNFDICKVNDLREFPSILNAKNLKQLKLFFVDNSSESRVSYPLFITNLTCLFAFKMCPQIKIKAGGCLVNLDNSQALMNALSILDDYVDIKFPFTEDEEQ